jgi:hypothetical protein
MVSNNASENNGDDGFDYVAKLMFKNPISFRTFILKSTAMVCELISSKKIFRPPFPSFPLFFLGISKPLCDS